MWVYFSWVVIVWLYWWLFGCCFWGEFFWWVLFCWRDLLLYWLCLGVRCGFFVWLFLWLLGILRWFWVWFVRWWCWRGCVNVFLLRGCFVSVFLMYGWRVGVNFGSVCGGVVFWCSCSVVWVLVFWGFGNYFMMWWFCVWFEFVFFVFVGWCFGLLGLVFREWVWYW